MNWDYRTMRPDHKTGRLHLNEKEEAEAANLPLALLETANSWGQDGWELVNVDNEAWYFKRAKGTQGGSLGRPRTY